MIKLNGYGGLGWRVRMERRKQEVDSNFLRETWQAYGTLTIAAAKASAAFFHPLLENSQNLNTNSLCFGLNGGSMLAGRPFLPNQKHKHETWKLQDYKAVCWLFTHLIQLQHINMGEDRNQASNRRHRAVFDRGEGFELISF